MKWLLQVVRGMCMGVADAIPGVSGGTIALVLGIYPRLIEAISGVGPTLIAAALRPDFWRAASAQVVRGGPDDAVEAFADGAEGRHAHHALFLAFLGAGVAVSLVTGARFIPTLLDLYPAQMKGLFFGLVFASMAIPIRMMQARSTIHYGLFGLFAVATYVFVGLPVDRSQNARGEVELLLARPVEERQVLTPTSLTFLTEGASATDEEGHGPELAFGPESSVVLEPGDTGVVIPVVARLAGTRANLAPGALAVIRGAPDGARVHQAAPTTGGVDPSFAHLFLAGMVAISAMILPGISGSFILLLLGLYHYVTFNVRLLVFEQDSAALGVVATLVLAVTVGLLTFARVLKWLFQRFPDATLAALLGLMLGSLRKLWPFTAAEAGGAEVNVWPETWGAEAGWTLLLFALGTAAVLLLEWAGRSRGHRP